MGVWKSADALSRFHDTLDRLFNSQQLEKKLGALFNRTSITFAQCIHSHHSIDQVLADATQCVEKIKNKQA